MNSLIFSALVVGIITAGFGFRKIRQSVTSAAEQTGREWQQLRNLLLSRHLVVTHLLDSLPQDSIRHFERTKLAGFNDLAEARLRDLNPENAVPDDYRAINNSQDDFLEQLVFLIDEIDQHPSIGKRKSVKGCLRGLDDFDRKIDEAKSTYNTAVIAYQVRMESRRVKCCAILDKRLSFRELNFGWTGSGSSVRQRG